MSQRGEATGQCAANLACADDANLHVFILRMDSAASFLVEAVQPRGFGVNGTILGERRTGYGF